MRILVLSWEYAPRVVGGLGRHVGVHRRAIVEEAQLAAATDQRRPLRAIQRDAAILELDGMAG